MGGESHEKMVQVPQTKKKKRKQLVGKEQRNGKKKKLEGRNSVGGKAARVTGHGRQKRRI